MGSTKPATRRRLLAFIALTDAPMPTHISLRQRDDGRSVVSLDFASTADAQAWCRHHDMATTTRRGTYDPDKVFLHHEQIDWHGWVVYLGATDAFSSGDPLEKPTREALTAVAGAR
jgi:hypothetical protein